MDCVAFPRKLFTDEAFIALKPRTQVFLMALYAKHDNERTFIIDILFPCEYGMRWGVHVDQRISELVKSGLIIEEGMTLKASRYRRVFRFKYSNSGDSYLKAA